MAVSEFNPNHPVQAGPQSPPQMQRCFQSRQWSPRLPLKGGFCGATDVRVELIGLGQRISLQKCPSPVLPQKEGGGNGGPEEKRPFRAGKKAAQFHGKDGLSWTEANNSKTLTLPDHII